MIVTDLQYHLDGYLVQKLDKIIKRCVNPKIRKDALLIIEGAEGEGKTNTSEAISYYFKYKTGRPINMFFRLKNLIEFAKNTNEQIIIWDEPALDSLSADWYKAINKDLIRLLMTCRKKRHFLIFNMVRFYKFSEYVIVDRAVGLIHMYTNDNSAGRFAYIKKGKLEKLYTTYRSKKSRDYKHCRSFGGKFPIVEKYLEKMGITIEGQPNCSLADYERLKDAAIESIGQEQVKETADKRKIKELKDMFGRIKPPILTYDDLAAQLKITDRTLLKWRNNIDLEGSPIKTEETREL